MLGCGIVDLEAICGFFNCHLVLIDQVDQFSAFGRLDGVVASLVFGERRDRIRKRLRFLCSRSGLRLDVAAHSS